MYIGGWSQTQTKKCVNFAQTQMLANITNYNHLINSSLLICEHIAYKPPLEIPIIGEPELGYCKLMG